MAVGASPPPAPLPVGLFHFRGFLLLLAAALLLSGCQGRSRSEMVVWSGLKEPEIEVLRVAAAEFTRAEGVPVRFVQVPFDELQPKVQVSVPVGQGPDLVTGPQDWIGPFATANLIQPIAPDEATLKAFIPVSLDVMRERGKLYGLPLSVTALGLVTNRKLVPRPPETMDELIAVAGRLTGDGRYGFLFDDTDFYGAWPFFGGYGAYLFGKGPQGLDPQDVGLDNAGAVRAGQLIADFHHRYHLIPVGTEKNSANALFLGGKCAMTITGPWSLHEYRERGIDYVFSPIPRLDNGRWPSPMVGVDGLMLTTSTRDAGRAARLMAVLAGREAQVQLHLSAGRIPARRDSQADPRVASNPDVQAIGRSVEHGTPMPTIPALAQVWEPMADALRRITAGGDEPKAALDAAGQRIRKKIRMMMQ